MRLSVPFNGEDDLIPQLSKYPEVEELYGKLTTDFVGGGKHSFQTPSVSRKEIVNAIRKTHEYGLEFNYLLNTSCLDNKEWTPKGKRKIIQFIEWIVNLDTDSITVSTPYLMELIKKYFPKVKLYISTLAGINTARKARYWEDLGASRLTLLNVDINRDFPMIREIRRNVKCQLKLILNSNCLNKCPLYRYHANVAAHASQSTHLSKGFVIDYCRIQCRYQQIINPVNFINSTWIRPEDVCHYERLGIDYFKIIDRGMSTEKILSIVKSYAARSYEGNLLDLFPMPLRNNLALNADLLRKIKYFFRPFTANIFRLRKLAELVNSAVYIDNKKLNGFIEHLMQIECSKLSCRQCGYCDDISSKTVSVINIDLNRRTRDSYRDCLGDIVSGKMFKYF